MTSRTRARDQLTLPSLPPPAPLPKRKFTPLFTNLQLDRWIATHPPEEEINVDSPHF